MTNPIRILIADDKKEICESLEQNIRISSEKFGLTKYDLHIAKVFTEHAYDHGCKVIADGFKPDICLFDLVFNGYTGIDLYKYLLNNMDGKKVFLCIYTGVERGYQKRKDAEVLASQFGASNIVKIVPKPNVSELLHWYEDLLINDWNKEKIIQTELNDPFDLL